MVDLPEAESPVSQIVKPFWPRRPKRSCLESDGCQVMLLELLSVGDCDGGETSERAEATHVAILSGCYGTPAIWYG